MLLRSLRDLLVCSVTIREGQILTSHSYFPSLPQKGLDEEPSMENLWQQIFSAFIGFYYLDAPEKIPALIITNHPVDDQKTLQDALSQQRGKLCRLQVNPVVLNHVGWILH